MLTTDEQVRVSPTDDLKRCVFLLCSLENGVYAVFRELVHHLIRAGVDEQVRVSPAYIRMSVFMLCLLERILFPLVLT